jgi:hypothetical protein
VVSSAPGLQFDPDAAATATGFVVLFGDLRASDPNGPYVSDIFGSQVPGDFVVADDPLHAELEPALQPVPVTTRSSASPPSATRLRWRTIAWCTGS